MLASIHDRIEVRMLGRLYVRRSNGEIVDPEEWSTGKTADLLRLLALSGNRPVSVQSLINNLWPDVNEDKARASLRTAASRVRQVLGEPCIERRLGGLILRNSWTDVAAFQTIVHDVSTALRAGDHAQVVALTREAEALYVADFQAYDDKSSWATETREALSISRQALLADAGEAALHLKWMRDAIDFSKVAIAEDPCSERPHRTLMKAHMALGEIELALRAFEHCRVCLSQELGADPSPQTRALHIQILTGDAEELALKPFVGREPELAKIAAVLRTAIASEGCDLVCLTGQRGSGRGALLTEAAHQVENAHVRLLLQGGPTASNVQNLASTVSGRRNDITVLGLLHGDPSWEVALMQTFFSGLDPTVARVVALGASPEVADLLADMARTCRITMHRVDIDAISDEALEELATAALSGKPTVRLLKELSQQSQNLAGRAVSVLRDWLAAGWVISTLGGLDLYTDPHALVGDSPVGNYFRITLEQLTLEQRDFCHILAMLDRPATAELLARLHTVSGDVDLIQAQLDELADLGVLSVGTQGYEFRNRAIRDAFEQHLRPAVRARTQRLITHTLDVEHTATGT